MVGCRLERWWWSTFPLFCPPALSSTTEYYTLRKAKICHSVSYWCLGEGVGKTRHKPQLEKRIGFDEEWWLTAEESQNSSRLLLSTSGKTTNDMAQGKGRRNPGGHNTETDKRNRERRQREQARRKKAERSCLRGRSGGREQLPQLFPLSPTARRNWRYLHHFLLSFSWEDFAAAPFVKENVAHPPSLSPCVSVTGSCPLWHLPVTLSSFTMPSLVSGPSLIKELY